MESSTPEYKAAIALASRTTRITGTLTLANLSTVSITDGNIVQGSLYFSEQCVSGDDLEIGNVYASEMGVSLITPTVTPYALAGAKLALSFGIDIGGGSYEDISLGVFYITEVERRENYVAVKALDGMILLDKLLGATNVTAQTPQQLITNACSTAGVTLATLTAAFNTYPNYNMSLTLPADSGVKTCRDLIMWVCQVNCTFARMNRAGQLEIRPLTGSSVKTISADERYAPTVVSDVTVKVTGIEEQVKNSLYTTGTTTSMMVLQGNPLLESQTPANISAALAAILAKITLAEYTPFDISFIGDPTIQAGDYITLSGTGSIGADPIGLVTHTGWQYRGKHTLVAAGQTGLVRSIYDQTEKKPDYISASRIYGDTLTLGGANNANGVAIIKDSTGADRIKIANNGLDFFDSAGAVTANISTTIENKTITVGTGKDFATIQAAIDSLPKIINHTIDVVVYNGTYAENVFVTGFSGSGSLYLLEVSGQSATVSTISAESCHLRGLYINGFTMSNLPSVSAAITITDCTNVHCGSIVDTSSGTYGVYFTGCSIGGVSYSTISNKQAAVGAGYSSIVDIGGLAGTGNLAICESSSSIIIDWGGSTATSSTQLCTDGGIITPSSGGRVWTDGNDSSLAKVSGQVFTGDIEVNSDNARFTARRPPGGTGAFAGMRVYDDTNFKGALYIHLTTGLPTFSPDGSNYYELTTANNFATPHAIDHALTDWTPTLGGITKGNGTVIARYRKLGKEVFFELQCTFGSTTAITGQVSFTLPVNTARRHMIYGDALDSGATVYMLSGDLNGSTCTVRAVNAAGTYASPYTTLSSTIPMTWVSGDRINISGVYEAD